MKAIISCPICHSGKVSILEHRYKADNHMEYKCLCRGSCKYFTEFTVSIRVPEVEE